MFSFFQYLGALVYVVQDHSIFSQLLHLSLSPILTLNFLNLTIFRWYFHLLWFRVFSYLLSSHIIINLKQFLRYFSRPISPFYSCNILFFMCLQLCFFHFLFLFRHNLTCIHVIVPCVCVRGVSMCVCVIGIHRHSFTKRESTRYIKGQHSWPTKCVTTLWSEIQQMTNVNE